MEKEQAQVMRKQLLARERGAAASQPHAPARPPVASPLFAPPQCTGLDGNGKCGFENEDRK